MSNEAIDDNRMPLGNALITWESEGIEEVPTECLVTLWVQAQREMNARLPARPTRGRLAMPEQFSVTIGRPHCGDEREVMTVSLRDTISRERITEFEMPLDDFMRCLTGLAEVPARVVRFIDPDKIHRIGKTRSTRRVTCPKIAGDKVAQRLEALRHVPDGWELTNDGTGSRQDGDEHAFVVARWD